MNSPWWLLPGFLGNASHFGTLPRFLDDACLIEWGGLAKSSLAATAEALARKARDNHNKPWLVGYSLGARVALHVALQHAGDFAGVIALSAHPGFKNEREKKQRCAEDTEWANLLRQNPQEFWTRWNRRESLSTSALPQRSVPTPEEASQWASILEDLSTGRQTYLPPFLAEVRLPLLAIAGENDATFTQFLEFFPINVGKVKIAGAGHRIPLERPQELAELLNAFRGSHHD